MLDAEQPEELLSVQFVRKFEDDSRIHDILNLRNAEYEDKACSGQVVGV